MNSRSEHRVSYHVRSSIAFICHVMYCLLCVLFIYCFFPPLLLSGSPDDRCRCPCDRLRRRQPFPPTVELPGKQCPLTSSIYSLLVFACLFALGIVVAMLLTFSNA